jgi:hypothetical protein
VNDLLTKKSLLDNIFKTFNELGIYKSGVIYETVISGRRSSSTISLDKNHYLPIRKRPIFFVSAKTHRDLINFVLDFSDLYISNLSKETLMRFSGKKSFYINNTDVEGYDYKYPYLMFLSRFYYSKNESRVSIYFVHFDAEKRDAGNFYYFSRGLIKNLKIFNSYKVLRNITSLLEIELNGKYLI